MFLKIHNNTTKNIFSRLWHRKKVNSFRIYRSILCTILHAFKIFTKQTAATQCQQFVKHISGIFSIITNELKLYPNVTQSANSLIEIVSSLKKHSGAARPYRNIIREKKITMLKYYNSCFELEKMTADKQSNEMYATLDSRWKQE